MTRQQRPPNPLAPCEVREIRNTRQFSGMSPRQLAVICTHDDCGGKVIGSPYISNASAAATAAAEVHRDGHRQAERS